MEVFKNLHPQNLIEPEKPGALKKKFQVRLDPDLLVEGGSRDGFYTFPALLGSEVCYNTVTDPTHVYLNELYGGFSFRTPEIENKDLIALGCSQTYGVGVCEESTWPALLAKKLNLSYANIAVPGTSVARSVTSFFSYIEKYGKPKAVAILLPDMYRMYIPVGNPHTSAQNLPKEQKIKMVNVAISPNEGLAPSVSKKPHKVEEIFYPEISYSQGFLMLNTLLIFCKYANIAVVVDTWERELSHILNSLDYLSEEVFANAYVSHPEEDCLAHEKFKSTLKHDEFYSATDRTKNRSITEEYKSHMGAHSHIHFAEAMATKLKNQFINRKLRK
jgi:hypothetical protein